MDITKAEVEVGLIAPDFSLNDNTGKTIRLSDYRGQQHVVLYFMREFMCLQCQGHVVQLGKLNDQLKALDTQVLVIGGGNSKGADRVTMMLKPPFPVLIDPDRSVYQQYDLQKVMIAIQRSGTFLIDKAGVVRYIHQVTNPGASLNKVELLQHVKKLHQQGG